MDNNLGYTLNLRKKVGHDPIFMPASGCILIKDYKVLLQKRQDNGKWAVHGGALELGETFKDALIREVKEELGIKVINPIFIGIYSGEKLHFFYPNNDEVYAVSAFYLVLDYEGDFNIDKNEVYEIKWFSIDELPSNLNEPDIDGLHDAIDYYKKYY